MNPRQSWNTGTNPQRWPLPRTCFGRESPERSQRTYVPHYLYLIGCNSLPKGWWCKARPFGIARTICLFFDPLDFKRTANATSCADVQRQHNADCLPQRRWYEDDLGRRRRRGFLQAQGLLRWPLRTPCFWSRGNDLVLESVDPCGFWCRKIAVAAAMRHALFSPRCAPASTSWRRAAGRSRSDSIIGPVSPDGVDANSQLLSSLTKHRSCVTFGRRLPSQSPPFAPCTAFEYGKSFSWPHAKFQSPSTSARRWSAVTISGPRTISSTSRLHGPIDAGAWPCPLPPLALCRPVWWQFVCANLQHEPSPFAAGELCQRQSTAPGALSRPLARRRSPVALQCDADPPLDVWVPASTERFRQPRRSGAWTIGSGAARHRSASRIRIRLLARPPELSFLPRPLSSASHRLPRAA